MHLLSKSVFQKYFQQNDIQIFIGLLCESNAGNGTWSPGWRILKIEKDGQLAVEKNGLTIWIPVGDAMMEGVVISAG
jgi:hypothetical protein